MSAVIDFAESHLRRWRDGQPEFGEDMIAVVKWRGRNAAYLFDRGFWEEFLKWVSDIRDRQGYSRLHQVDLIEEGGDGSITYNESEEEHLERIGCRVVDLREWISDL